MDADRTDSPGYSPTGHRSGTSKGKAAQPERGLANKEARQKGD
jgi:hypothetical protein